MLSSIQTSQKIFEYILNKHHKKTDVIKRICPIFAIGEGKAGG